MRLLRWPQELERFQNRDLYPISRMDNCIDYLGIAADFPTSDASSSYWKVEFDGTDRNNTAFTSHHWLYRYVLMPFDFKSAPET